VRRPWTARRRGGRSGPHPLRWVWVLVAWVAGGCAAATGGAGPYPQLGQYAGREITAVHFVSPQPFSTDTLKQLIETRPSRCHILFFPVCIPGTSIGREEHTLDMATLASDAVRLAVFYRQNGYFGTHVEPSAQPRGGKVAVTFAVLRGDAVRLDSLQVTGTEGVLAPDSLKRHLPLKEGATFNLAEFVASADTVAAALKRRGYAHAEVLRNYGVDTVTNRATASLDAIPGPVVRVDSIVVVGARHLGRRSVLRQLSIRKGDLLRQSALLDSQRNLYGLDIVQFATVDIAPDSLQRDQADSSSATVEVRISEAPLHVVEAAIGYGSIECFRAHSSWTDRSLMSGARRLSLQADVSKIGLGGPTYSPSIASSICHAYAGDEFRKQLDYHLSADFTQPYFFSAHNQLALGVYADRTSEPGLFQRTARGGRIAVARLFRTQDIITWAIDLEHGQTTASPAIFCLALLVCEPSDIEQLSRFRWRDAFSASIARDRTDDVLNPTRGYRFRTEVSWAAAFLGSDVRFVRWTGEASTYHQLRPGWVVAGYVRLGTFFNTASVTSLFGSSSFLPPEERFFAGGATSVRGFDRNALGPGVYVADTAVVDTTGAYSAPPGVKAEFVPVGGTAVAVGSGELRFPSPLLGKYVALATFVDIGAVGTQGLWNLGPDQFRATPGFGFRVGTPVGPARLDIAYNPYGTPQGPLFVTDQKTGALIRVLENYHPGGLSFIDRFKINVAVGQAF
jgi:outer membrane protein insertion porin family